MKETLKTELKKIELVKPNSIEKRLSNEVEALCESFSCGHNTSNGCCMNTNKAGGDTEENIDILF